MKKLTYLTSLGLSLFLTVACQQENIVPDNNNNPLAVDRGGGPTPPTAGFCYSYSYYTRSGIVQIGSAYSQEMMVAFKPRLAMAKKQAILSQFPAFDRIMPGEIMSSTGDALTFVKMKPTATCLDVENVRLALNQRADVDMVLLSYVKPNVAGYTQYFNGIKVKLFPGSTLTDLQRFARQSKTEIISTPNATQDYYRLRVTSRSASDIFGINGALNANSAVASTIIDQPAVLIRKGSDVLASAEFTHND